VRTFEGYLEQKKYQEAYDLAENDESFLGRVLSAGMGKISVSTTKPRPPCSKPRQRSHEARTPLGHHRADRPDRPDVRAARHGRWHGPGVRGDRSKDQTPRPSDLAQGIGTALVTTVVGLWIAIPAIAFYSVVRIILSRRLFEVGNVSEGLMKRFKK